MQLALRSLPLLLLVTQVPVAQGVAVPDDALQGRRGPSSFGAALAWNGHELFSGDPRQERVLAFARDDSGAWVEQAELVPDPGAAQAGFGAALALDGNNLIVGAPGAAGDGGLSGAVFVYEHDGSRWWPTTSLQPVDGQPGNGFGTALALDGSNLVVGAPGADGGGAVFVYTREVDGSWSLQTTLNGDAGSAAFGTALDLAGPRMLVGDPLFGGQGAAYYFQRSNDTWRQVHRLQRSERALGDRFGPAVHLDGERVLIGAPGAEIGQDGARVRSGLASIFEGTPGGQWHEVQTLVAPSASNGDGFGSVLVLSGENLFVGAPGQAREGTDGAGAVHWFAMGGPGTWEHVLPLGSSEVVSGAGFGQAVAVSGDELAAGAPYALEPQVFSFELQSLMHGPEEVSLSAGGQQGLFLRPGANWAGRRYLLLGSVSGTEPGLSFPARHVTLPLNSDFYFESTIYTPSLTLTNSIGRLSDQGQADAAFVLAPGRDPAFVGLEVHHAYLVFDRDARTWFASNAVRARLVP